MARRDLCGGGSGNWPSYRDGGPSRRMRPQQVRSIGRLALEPENPWPSKTDAQLVDAVAHIQDYTPEVQLVIRSELARRQSEPKRPQYTKRIVEVIGNEQLRWVECPGMVFLLYADTERIAALHYRTDWGFASATAESADGCWIFTSVADIAHGGCFPRSRDEFWQTTATIRVCGSDTDLAVLKDNAVTLLRRLGWDYRCALELRNGRRFFLRSNFQNIFWKGNWQTAFMSADESGAQRRCRGQSAGTRLAQRQVALAIPEEAAKDQSEASQTLLHELPWLALLGMYLQIERHQRMDSV